MLVGGEKREWLGCSSFLTLDLHSETEDLGVLETRLASVEGQQNLEELNSCVPRECHGSGNKGTAKVLRDGDPPSLGFLVLFSPKIRMISGCCLQHWV